MEKWDLYDKHRNKLNKQIVRGETLKDGEYHLVVHICIFNSKGEMLIQQRSSTKKEWPNLWDLSCGGSATIGDTSQQAASRELFEELGISYDFTNLRPYFTINFEQGFDDIYLIVKEVAFTDLILQEEEVQQVQWASKTTILQMIKENQFIPYYKGIISYLFDCQFSYGSIRL